MVTGNVRAANHSRMTTAATFLARTRISMMEQSLLEYGFAEMDGEDKGDFAQEGFPSFRWYTNVERIELPADATQKVQQASSKATQSTNPMEMLCGFMGGFMATLMDPIRLGLQESVRKLTVRVKWNEPGKPEQSFEVVNFLTDPVAARIRGHAQRDGCHGHRHGYEHQHGGQANFIGHGDLGGEEMTMSSRRQNGFTLIEIMLALALMAFLTSLLWGTFAQTAKVKKRIEQSQDRTHTVRVALMRMSREIEMAFVSAPRRQARRNGAPCSRAVSHADFDELRFSWFGHQRFRADQAEGDTALVSYFSQPDPDDSR